MSYCYEHQTLRGIQTHGNNLDPTTRENLNVKRVNENLIRELFDCYAIDANENKIPCNFTDSEQPCYFKHKTE